MRRARLSFVGSFHHVINRGYEGKPIFENSRMKSHFLDLIIKNARDLRIRILAYCLMDNHYHLILENTSGRMSDFFKRVNGCFGSFYRYETGGKGYVFQDRYKSYLIQDDSYLIMGIGYVLKNPVRAGIVNNFFNYKWSSAGLYFKKQKSDFIDVQFVEQLFLDRMHFLNYLDGLNIDVLPVVGSRRGSIIGEKEVSVENLNKISRRSKLDQMDFKREDDFYFDPVEKVIREFENGHKIKIDGIDTTTYEGKRLRAQLLVDLKERSGLKYTDINKIGIFGDLRLHSLGKIYRNAKDKMKSS